MKSKTFSILLLILTLGTLALFGSTVMIDGKYVEASVTIVTAQTPPPSTGNVPGLYAKNGKVYLESGKPMPIIETFPARVGDDPKGKLIPVRLAMPNEVHGSVPLCAPDSATRYNIRGYLNSIGFQCQGSAPGTVVVETVDGKSTRWYVR